MDRLSHVERLVLLRIMPTAVLVLLAVSIGLAMLVSNNDDNIDKLDDDITTLEESVESVETSTQRVRQFVDGLEDETSDEAERNAAITRAVELVPQIKGILCQEFPEADACQG